MQFDTGKEKTRIKKGNRQKHMDEPTTSESSVKSKYMVDVMIPPECLDDDGECEHNRHSDKQEQNPV